MFVGVSSRVFRECIEHGSPEDTGCSWINGSVNTVDERAHLPSLTSYNDRHLVRVLAQVD